MSWVDELPAHERNELRDAGRIGTTRFDGPEQLTIWPPAAFCACPGPANGYPQFHLRTCSLREAEGFA